jgi:hypothetical protein
MIRAAAPSGVSLEKAVADRSGSWHRQPAFPGESMPGLTELAIGVAVALTLALALFRSAA